MVAIHGSTPVIKSFIEAGVNVKKYSESAIRWMIKNNCFETFSEVMDECPALARAADNLFSNTKTVRPDWLHAYLKACSKRQTMKKSPSEVVETARKLTKTIKQRL